MSDSTQPINAPTPIDSASATAPQPIVAQPAKPAPLPVLDGRTTSEAVLFEIRRVIVGQDQMLERVLVALLSGGHLLLEGVPGLAKTLTIKTLADVLDASFRRIQFTPDLLPADLTGTLVYDPKDHSFTALAEEVTADMILDRILAAVPEPRLATTDVVRAERSA